MEQIKINYKGFVLMPLAAFDAGSFCAMFVLTAPDGAESASGELGRFESRDRACQYALEAGMRGIDDWHSS
jgi:hypothetical protein